MYPKYETLLGKFLALGRVVKVSKFVIACFQCQRLVVKAADRSKAATETKLSLDRETLEPPKSDPKLWPKQDSGSEVAGGKMSTILGEPNPGKNQEEFYRVQIHSCP